MSVTEHKKQAPKEVRCKIVTISDTRTEETDSGQLLHELLKEAGHKVTSYEIVKDDKESIQQAVLAGYHKEDVDVVLTNGGTGITKRDVTIEAVSALLDKEIVGFGELFRMISYLEDIGSSAMLSRAIGGTIGRKVVFSMPGSSGAVRLAMNKLILPELGHITFELHRQSVSLLNCL
ncbi:molybdenum cofactor biosynthesis protein B [Bacillus cereus]